MADDPLVPIEETHVLEYMQRKKVSGRALAKLVGVAQMTVWSAIRRNKRVHRSLRIAIATALDVTPKMISGELPLQEVLCPRCHGAGVVNQMAENF